MVYGLSMARETGLDADTDLVARGREPAPDDGAGPAAPQSVIFMGAGCHANPSPALLTWPSPGKGKW